MASGFFDLDARRHTAEDTNASGGAESFELPRLPDHLILHAFSFLGERMQRRLASTNTSLRHAMTAKYGSVKPRIRAHKQRNRQSSLVSAFVAIDSLLFIAAPLALLASLLLGAARSSDASVSVSIVSLPIVLWCVLAIAATIALGWLQRRFGVEADEDSPWTLLASHMAMPALLSVMFARELTRLTSFGAVQLAFALIAATPGMLKVFVLGC
jgi:hypothetical protein